MTPQATIHVRSSESGDAISVIEVRSDASFDGPPLHHHDFDEAFYVRDGELTFRLGAPARHLLICTPSSRLSPACRCVVARSAVTRGAAGRSRRPAGAAAG